MTTSVFSGSDFKLESVTQIALATIRVRYTNNPEAVNPSGAHDALNPALYTITGALPLVVTVAHTVAGDAQAIDLTLSAPLIAGTWLLSCGGIQMVSTRPLQSPTAMAFYAIYMVGTATVANGALSDTSATVIRKHLNPYFKGLIWNALIAALAVSDDINWDNARLAFNQLFKSSASGIYLDRKCADDGLTRPPNIGMPDDLYRQYAIKTTTSKLTQESLLEVLEVFYGSDALRAYAETELTSPFALVDRDTLDLLLDERQVVTVQFTDKDFVLTSAASAREVAAAITRGCARMGSNAFALAVVDSTTGLDKVRIYSASLGLGSAVRVTGGTAQGAFEFPLALHVATAAITIADAYSWTAALDPDGDNTTFTMTTAFPCKMDLSLVQTGDWVMIDATGSGMPAGIYNVLDCTVYYAGANIVQSFQVEGNALISLGLSTKTATQVSARGYRFYRPLKQTIQRGDSRTVVVSQTVSGITDIIIPATTQAVGRTQYTAAYMSCPDPLVVTAMRRVGSTVTVTAANTLTVGSQILVEDASSTRAAAVIYIPAGPFPKTRCSVNSLWSSIDPQSLESTYGSTVTYLPDGDVIRVGGIATVAGISATDTEIFRVAFPIPGTDGENSYAYQWVAGPSLNVGRGFHASVPLASGNLVSIGGYLVAGASELDSIETFDPIAYTWTTSGATLATARSWVEACMLADDTILVVGGFSGAASLASCEIFDPAADTVGAGPTMMEARTNHAICVLADGRVLITGGRVVAAGGSTIATITLNATDTISYTCEVYEPLTGHIHQVGSMAYARMGHELVLLNDGRVLCVGGWGYIAGHADSRIAIRAMEIFDPGTNRWSVAGNLTTGRVYPVAKLLPTCNKVVVACGMDSAEVPITLDHSEYVDGTTLKVSVVHNPFTYSVLGGLPINLKNSAAVMPNDRLFFCSGVQIGGVNPESAMFVHGDDLNSTGGLGGVFRVASANPASFTYLTPNAAHYTVGSVTNVRITPVAAVAGHVGPYVFEPDAGAAITAVSTVTSTALAVGHQYGTLDVGSTAGFPDAEGWICLGFGTSVATWPIRYLGVYSATALIVDYSYVMPRSIPAGASCILLAQKGPWVPAAPESVGAFYLTASFAGRTAAIAGIEASRAAGFEVNVTTLYPGDKGLGNAGYGSTGNKISDRVGIWGDDTWVL